MLLTSSLSAATYAKEPGGHRPGRIQGGRHHLAAVARTSTHADSCCTVLYNPALLCPCPLFPSLHLLFGAQLLLMTSIHYAPALFYLLLQCRHCGRILLAQRQCCLHLGRACHQLSIELAALADQAALIVMATPQCTKYLLIFCAEASQTWLIGQLG